MSADHPPGLDLDRLRALLDRERPGLVTGPLTGRLIEGGRSNLTYAVTDGTSQLGRTTAPARPCAGHRARHEARAPGDQRPAPDRTCRSRGRCCCARTTRCSGAPFYVMEFVEGTPYRTADQLAPLGPERTRDAVLSLVDTLVELHAVDPAEVGLADFGRPEGFLDRQLRRWGKQLDASRNRELAGHRRAARGARPRAAHLPRAGRRARRLPARQRADRRRTTGSRRSSTGRCPRSAIR